MPYLESALVSTKTVPASLSDFPICDVKQEPLDHHSEEPNSQKAAEKSNPDDWCLLEVKENDFEVFDEPEFKRDLIVPIRLHLEESDTSGFACDYCHRCFKTKKRIIKHVKFHLRTDSARARYEKSLVSLPETCESAAITFSGNPSLNSKRGSIVFCPQMTLKRPRSKNFSKREEDDLLHAIAPYADTVDDKGSGLHVWEKKKKAWDIITRNYNARGGHQVYRDSQALQIKYKLIKGGIRRDYAQSKRELFKTGQAGRPPPDPAAIKDPVNISLVGMTGSNAGSMNFQVLGDDISREKLDPEKLKKPVSQPRRLEVIEEDEEPVPSKRSCINTTRARVQSSVLGNYMSGKKNMLSLKQKLCRVELNSAHVLKEEEVKQTRLKTDILQGQKEIVQLQADILRQQLEEAKLKNILLQCQISQIEKS